MTVNDEPRRGRHDLDDAIDRVVRDMTRLEASDDAVARVMARVRGARKPRRTLGGFGIWSPHANWGFAATAALLMVLMMGTYWIRRPAAPPPLLASRPVPAVDMHPPMVSSGPTEVASARVVAAVPASDPAERTVRSTSIVEATAATAERAIADAAIVDAATANAAMADAASADAADEFHSDLSPRAGDLAMSGIAPAPLFESPALTVEPLAMRELTVDAIEPSPITVPSPIGPQR